jgi:hypothetical protein
LDIQTPRTKLPTEARNQMNLSKLTKLMSAVVGKDLAAYSLPVFLNEPLTIL